MTVSIQQGDIINWLRGREWMFQTGYLPRYHAVFCDPPYFLGSITKRFGKDGSAPAQYGRDGSFSRVSKGFMGKTWDGFESLWHYQAWVTEWSSHLLSAVYPGAMGLFFGGTRTYHRLAAGLEDAGWEIVDCLMFMYGSGFPKSLDIAKAIDREATDAARQWEGYKTHLKPAYEPVIVARAPRDGYTFAQLAQRFGTGALAVDACRVPTDETWTRSSMADIRANNYKSYTGRIDMPQESNPQGRYPSNVILGCACETDDHAPGCPVRVLDEQSGESGGGEFSISGKRPLRDNPIYGKPNTTRHAPDNYGDIGGASRFFYTAKAGSFERLVPGMVTLRTDLSPETEAFVRRRLQELNIRPIAQSVESIALDHE